MKKLFFITTILFSMQSFSQKAITSDNKRLDSLTSSFKTYSVILVVNDSVSEDPVKSNIIVELQRNYSFLKKKKMRSGETDFSIQINIKGIAIGLLDHKVTSQTDRKITRRYIDHTTIQTDGLVTTFNHQYSLDHLVSTGLVISSKGTDLITINLGSDVIIKRTYNYTENATGQSIDSQNAMNAKGGLNGIWGGFEFDFFEVFNNYKSAKL